MSQLVTLHVDLKSISLLCHMGDFGCGDGGWTPIMKIDGNKVNCLIFPCMSYRTFFSKYITSLKTYKFSCIATYLNEAFMIFLACDGTCYYTFSFLFRRPFIITRSTGVIKLNTTFQEGRLALTHKRPSYRPTGTHPSPRFVLV